MTDHEIFCQAITDALRTAPDPDVASALKAIRYQYCGGDDAGEGGSTP